MTGGDLEGPSADDTGWRWVIAAIGGVCAALGVVVLCGWHRHLTALVQVHPALVPMQYNTAICFVLAGSALALVAWRGESRWVPALSAPVAAVGTLTLGEYLFHADLGVDQLLFRSYIVTETSHPGRMSPVTGFCFVLAGVALVLLGWRRAPRWRPFGVGVLASLVISISVVALLGYEFGLPGTYGWGQLTRMAVHTAGGFSLLGAGLFIVAWRLARAPGERTPRWLPVSLALGIFTASLVLYFALVSKQDQEIVQTVRAGAESARDQIGVRMESRIRSLVRMARRWEFAGSTAQAAWEADATNHLHDFPDVQALEWMDEAHVVRWIVPLSGNERKLNLDLTREDRRSAAVALAEREQQPAITRVVTLFRGGLGFVVYVPIVVRGQSQGLLAAIFDAKECLQRYLPPTVAAGEAIRLAEGGLIFHERDAEVPPAREKWVVEEKIELQGATWQLRMWPTPALAARLDSPLPGVVFAVGVLGAALLAAVCFLAQRSSRQAAETARANAALQAALDEVKTLEALLPICSYCKRVRDDTGYWNQIDTYLHRHMNASFSHGFCPECAVKACAEFGIAVPSEFEAELAAGKFETNRPSNS